MREIDVSTLESVGRAGAGPWRLGDGAILKTTEHGHPLQNLAQAQNVFDAYLLAHDAGAGTPRPLEVVRAEDGFGVVVEYVPGLSLPAHIAFGSYSPQEAGEALGLLLRRLHGLSCAKGRDVRADFVRYARSLATRLPSHIADRLVALVDGIPEATCLLHGDAHLFNVVVKEGEPCLIDLELCGHGHPVFDLAITRTRLLLNDNAFNRHAEPGGRLVSQVVWESCFRTYYSGEPQAFLEEMDRVTAVLAEIEHCCFKLRIGAAPEGLSAEQRERVELCASRLDELLDRVERLYFETGATPIPGMAVPPVRS